MVTAADVEAIPLRDFTAEDVDAVRALISSYGVESHEGDPPLIRLALLRLVNGDRTTPVQWVAWAKLDWRDVLLAVHQTYGTSWPGPFLARSKS